MRIASGLVLLFLASGCDAASTLTPVESQTSMPGGAQSGSLALELTAPAQAQVGTPVPLKLRLRNTGKETVQVYLGGRPPYDFIVTTPTGAQVWRWSEGQIVQSILDIKTLNPGEQLEYEEQWPTKDSSGTPVSPGPYLVRGVLNMDPPEKLETAPKQLTITAR